MSKYTICVAGPCDDFMTTTMQPIEFDNLDDARAHLTELVKDLDLMWGDFGDIYISSCGAFRVSVNF